MVNYDQQRENMIFSQVLPNMVTCERLIRAMRETPREQFVESAYQSLAYCDQGTLLNEGRFLLSPMAFARLVQEARITRNDRVLDIAAGNGYSSIILSFLGKEVISLESSQDAVDAIAQKASEVEAFNIKPVLGELGRGWPTGAPYDVIVIEGTVESLPVAFKGQLCEGGRLITMVADKNGGIPRATLFTKFGDHMSSRTFFESQCPLLSEFSKKEGFRL